MLKWLCWGLKLDFKFREASSLSRRNMEVIFGWISDFSIYSIYFDFSLSWKIGRSLTTEGAYFSLVTLSLIVLWRIFTRSRICKKGLVLFLFLHRIYVWDNSNKQPQHMFLEVLSTILDNFWLIGTSWTQVSCQSNYYNKVCHCTESWYKEHWVYGLFFHENVFWTSIRSALISYFYLLPATFLLRNKKKKQHFILAEKSALSRAIFSTAQTQL